MTEKVSNQRFLAFPRGFEPPTYRLGELQPIVTLCQSEVR